MTKILNFFSSNQLKIIALIAMTVDHIGFLLLPQYPILRIIGRLSFPIFAYMIAEGCRYTKNRTKYLFVLSALGIAFQIVYFVADRSLFQGVFVSFSLGVGLVYAIDNAVKRKMLGRFYWRLQCCFLSALCALFCPKYCPIPIFE